jgi:hemin uptake protein HemP
MSGTGDREPLPSPDAASAPRDVAAAGTPRVVTSEALLLGDSQLAILHDRTVYFLRKTRFGKLILTK